MPSSLLWKHYYNKQLLDEVEHDIIIIVIIIIIIIIITIIRIIIMVCLVQ